MLLRTPEKLNNASIQLPFSKSIQNRLWVLNHLSKGEVKFPKFSDADDSVLMQRLLKRISEHKGGTCVLDCKNAGTVLRFLSAVCSISEGEYILQGSNRMHQRPVKDLVEPLREMGAQIEYLGEEGFPPLKIDGSKLFAPNPIAVDTSKSSQFLSALLLIAPFIKGGARFRYDPDSPSHSYIVMTLALLNETGCVINTNEHYINVKESLPQAVIEVERDWSSAAFFFSLVALSEESNPLEIELAGLNPNSIQGDSVLLEIFSRLGVKSVKTSQGIMIAKVKNDTRHFSYDFSDCPDLALPVIACCAGLEMMASFSGLRNLKFKESDRLKALQSELAKFGYDLRESSDDEAVLLNDCKITNKKAREDLSIETYHDHRMAMSFAPLVLKHDKLTILNPDAVEKSFPKFWEEFTKVVK